MAKTISLLPSLPDGWEEWEGLVVSRSKVKGGCDYEAEVSPSGYIDRNSKCRFVFYVPDDQSVDGEVEVGTRVIIRVPPKLDRFESLQTFELVVCRQDLNGFRVYEKLFRLGPNKRTYLYKYKK